MYTNKPESLSFQINISVHRFSLRFNHYPIYRQILAQFILAVNQYYYKRECLHKGNRRQEIIGSN